METTTDTTTCPNCPGCTDDTCGHHWRCGCPLDRWSCDTCNHLDYGHRWTADDMPGEGDDIILEFMASERFRNGTNMALPDGVVRYIGMSAGVPVCYSYRQSQEVFVPLDQSVAWMHD